MSIMGANNGKEILFIHSTDTLIMTRKNYIFFLIGPDFFPCCPRLAGPRSERQVAGPLGFGGLV